MPETDLSRPQENISPTIQLSDREANVIGLFEAGFQLSSRSNISAREKIVSALNYAMYRNDLSFIARYFHLSVQEPPSSSLGRESSRVIYINQLYEEYVRVMKPSNVQ